MEDHFSGHAKIYQKYRPKYPEELFSYLDTQAMAHECALDCATGNGQAALGLTPFFKNVIATDISQAQLDLAQGHPQVKYLCAPAEKIPMSENAADVVCVASGIHWFSLDAFFAEVRRVLRPRGLVAVWVYHGWDSQSGVHSLVREFEQEVVHKYWPQRFQINMLSYYQNLDFPFREVSTPKFSYKQEIDADWVIGYLKSWSATQRYINAVGEDPTEKLRARIEECLGGAKSELTFNLILRVGFN